MGESVSDLADATNVLVSASNVGNQGVQACLDLLANDERGLDRLLVVAVGQRPSEWQRWIDERPALADLTVGYVDVQTLTRSSATAETGASSTLVPAATISSPADLGALGTALTDLLGQAATAGDRVGLVVHSITDMLAFVDREFLFKFLHTLGARLRQMDAVGYYHLDSTAPDDKLETLFAHLCDSVVTIEDAETTVSPGYYAIDETVEP